MTINGNDIRMIRGDTEQLVVTCQLSDGTERPFEDGDTVTLTVAWPMGREVLQKTVTSFREGTAFVLLNHEDTNDLTPGEYAYDVQLTAKDGTVATIIPPARFVLEGDVTRDGTSWKFGDTRGPQGATGRRRWRRRRPLPDWGGPQGRRERADGRRRQCRGGGQHQAGHLGGGVCRDWKY